MHNVLFCGVGGQGVLTAAEICGVAAMGAGFHVKKSEVHGMAQRGGSVESHVRFGEAIYSPLIPPGSADLLVCFDRGEGERLADFLTGDGTTFLPYLDQFKSTGEDRRFLNTSGELRRRIARSSSAGPTTGRVPDSERSFRGVLGPRNRDNLA
jgi:indolepyruvate ferredoxin oxidoreductase beta subunit